MAVHKPTNQSTTARGGSPGNANDGDPTTVHDGRRCTETLKEPSPWWSVDLLQPYPVRAVSITTRGCCGEYLRIRIIITRWEVEKTAKFLNSLTVVISALFKLLLSTNNKGCAMSKYIYQPLYCASLKGDFLHYFLINCNT